MFQVRVACVFVIFVVELSWSRFSSGANLLEQSRFPLSFSHSEQQQEQLKGQYTKKMTAMCFEVLAYTATRTWEVRILISVSRRTLSKIFNKKTNTDMQKDTRAMHVVLSVCWRECCCWRMGCA